ncbi:MAG TPA: xanthine dehydrogenase family protein subunit M [bacterium]|nr:xanthine dehydrogenase family protein subunit M [bacterium]
MKAFAFLEPASVGEAVTRLAEGGSARIIAGGSDLLGELKEGTAHYERLVSLGRIGSLRAIAPAGDGLRIGAAVTLAELEHERRLAGPYRLLAEAARGVATPEIRNQGTLGGNLCQRPRCLHYRSPWIDCLKKGGTDCPAKDSEHQPYLAVMGASDCFAAHASDLAPPLLALDAAVVVAGPAGERTLPLAEFFTGPERDVRRENVLGPDEVLTAVVLPGRAADWRGTYLKARERTAGDFPLVSVAFGARMEGGVLREVRLVLGGVAPVPWPCPQAAALLEGQAPTAEIAARAAEAAFESARPLAGSAYKVQLGRALVTRAIEQVAAG